MKRLPALLLGAAALAAPARAAAADPPWHAGVDLGYTALAGSSTWNGFGGDARFGYAFNDAVQAVAEIDAGVYPSPRWTLVSGGVGAVYVLDVIRWVMWAGAEAGPAAILSRNPACGGAKAEPCTALELSLNVPFGLDYKITPMLAVGLGGRYQMLLLGYSSFTAFGGFARAEVTWGK